MNNTIGLGYVVTPVPTSPILPHTWVAKLMT